MCAVGQSSSSGDRTGELLDTCPCWSRLTVRCLQHVCLTIAVALVFHTDLDSPFGPTFSADSADSAFIASQQFHVDLEARKLNYDLFLVLTFVICIPGCVQKSGIQFVKPTLTDVHACAGRLLSLSLQSSGWSNVCWRRQTLPIEMHP